MKIDPRHLMQLSAIVETGGLTEAATLLGSSQPAISRMLSALELRLGQPLVIRDRRPLQPTALGQVLAEQGDAIRLAARRSAEAADALRRGERGTIRIGGTPFFTDALISGMIAEFHQTHPSVRVDQRYGYTTELKTLVKSGQLDLAICPVELLEEGDEDLTFEELLPGRNVVACRVGHPLFKTHPLRPEALLEFPWIEPPPGSALIADLRTALLAIGATHVSVCYAGGSLASIVNYLKVSDSLTILPHSVVFAMQNAKEISAIPLDLEHPRRSLAILRSGVSPAPASSTRFAKHVISAFQELRTLIRQHEQAVVWGSGD
ncbi:LysR family transcriptional regulator [Sedimentitalea todarodis]|uniref:LysR family transcriptional regulator n=1 Tax=Sedimentitalea todarodis TaxID=1631240 RepID=A0ABU3VGT3_9RHOB|nr:LysR family transcriptional regulator [Sedimentitalea todarodis]MDU9005388.1 LysR family transcriptional regulator [Sedimentitalea todarodis]